MAKGDRDFITLACLECRERTYTTKKKSAITITMMITMVVLIAVSLRLGQEIFWTS